MLKINALLCIGKGYNLRNDDTVPAAIFATDDDDLKETPFGIKIPGGMKMHKVEKDLI
jgi:hypothetical protein